MTLSVKEPGTGKLITELKETDPSSLPGILHSARTAQLAWSQTPLRARARVLRQVRQRLIDHADQVASLLSRENGKPVFEALSNEVLPSVQMITYFCKVAEEALADSPIALQFLLYKRSYVQHVPMGVVAVISPWNYPFLLPMGTIVMALLAGNAVVFKPSEVTPLIGLELVKLFEAGGLPKGLLTPLIGGGTLGSALIDARPDKVFFTGSVATGKKVMRQCGEHLIPVNLELGGKDPMIVFEDADLELAASAAIWGGLSNSGQMCSSVERILVHATKKDSFLSLLRLKISKLRYTENLSETDLGFSTYETQKIIYDTHLSEARNAGVTFNAGGEFRSGRKAVQPTVVSGDQIETLKIYREESFGPFLAVTTFESEAEALHKANDSAYGLCASVFTQNLKRGEKLARELKFGTVLVNETPYTAGLAEAPWGGMRDAGIGRTHSKLGFTEFVHSKHVQLPRAKFLQFKSPWWFPYTPHQAALFKAALKLYSNGVFAKLRALGPIVRHLVAMMFKEPRL